VKLDDGTTKCKFYNQRVGKKLGYGNVCGLRTKEKDSPFDFVGCPYNTNKPIAGVDIEFYEGELK